jgi:hypothetical protein
MFPQREAHLPQLTALAVAWAERISDHILASGSPLSGAERAIASRVGVASPDKVRVLLVDGIPVPDNVQLAQAAQAIGLLGPSTAGMTLGYGILVVRRHHSIQLLSHELRHVAQHEAYGTIARYLPEYLEQILKYGYRDAPLEQDARAFEVAGQTCEAGGETG